MISANEILKARILIVDDEEPNIRLLEAILSGAGYSAVTSTRNPRKVCELHKNNPFDLILLDIRMPGMDGFQVLEGLGKIRTRPFPSVLVVTAEPAHKKQALLAGAKDFVTKPIELVEVLNRIHNMLEANLSQKELYEHRDDNPALPSIIQRNIRKIILVRHKAIQDQSLQDRVASAMTSFSGSMFFFYVHLVWFSIWIALNTGHLGTRIFDPYPYGLLTMIVSLEAIFLSTFVLISQNSLGKETERLTDLGLQTGLLTEHELTRVIQMLRAIQSQVGITNDEVSNLADDDLEMETKPEDVLAEIKRLQKREDDQDHFHYPFSPH